MGWDPAIQLDPEVARLLEAAVPAPARESVPLADARAQMEEQCRFWNRELPEMTRALQLELEGPAGPLRCRLMSPEAASDLPVIVYLHGGGWTLGSLDSHHRLMRCLAREAGAALLAVDYRLAPEHPFPAPLEDALAAVRWLRARAPGHGINPDRMVLAGDSSGANLALGALLRLRDGGEPLPRGGALFYGCYQARTDTASHRAYGDGSFRLSTDEMTWFWANYLGEGGTGDVYAEPLLAALHALPPLFLNVGTVDPLADDTRALAGHLEAAGVPYELLEYPGQVHGLLQMTLDVAAARSAMRDAGAAIRRMLQPD